jgi:Flp pilus assembly protein TadD
VYGALGQGEQARAAFGQALGIAERLGAAEPDRPDCQRDLAASSMRIGMFKGARHPKRGEHF